MAQLRCRRSARRQLRHPFACLTQSRFNQAIAQEVAVFAQRQQRWFNSIDKARPFGQQQQAGGSDQGHCRMLCSVATAKVIHHQLLTGGLHCEVLCKHHGTGLAQVDLVQLHPVAAWVLPAIGHQVAQGPRVLTTATRPITLRVYLLCMH